MGFRVLGVGWWEYNSHPEKGTFLCQAEHAERPYRVKKVNRWLTVLYVPLIPLGVVAQVVECRKCKAIYGMATARTPETPVQGHPVAPRSASALGPPPAAPPAAEAPAHPPLPPSDE